ncbi:melatonin receptor type 1C-like [Amphiura filiformis]|uniref:melatonin receptor type 1C-like n=1 Tax=Amphiura filiformis TaxID=82378 RepID=UPI003B20CC7D
MNSSATNETGNMVTIPYIKAKDSLFVEQQSDTTEVTSVLHHGDRYAVASLFFIIMSAGLFGNGLVVFAVILSKKLRCVTYAFVVALSIADLFTMLNIPWAMVAILSTDGWPLPDWICSSCAFAMITCIGFSISTMACIAVNRLILFTVSRVTYEELFTPIKTTLIIFLCAIINLAVASPPILFDFGKLGYDKRFSSCTWDKTHPMTQTYELFVILVQYPIPLLVCISCYAKLFLILKRQAKKLLSKSDSSSSTDSANLRRMLTRRQVEVTKSMFYILCTFILCTAPFAVVMVVNSPGRLGPYTGCILLLNGAINPLIYAVKLPSLKQEMKCVLLCQLSKIGRSNSGK